MPNKGDQVKLSATKQIEAMCINRCAGWGFILFLKEIERKENRSKGS
jgi:hypothetical protein